METLKQAVDTLRAIFYWIAEFIAVGVAHPGAYALIFVLGVIAGMKIQYRIRAKLDASIPANPFLIQLTKE